MANEQSGATARHLGPWVRAIASVSMIVGLFVALDVAPSNARDPYFTAPDFPNVNCEFQFGSPPRTVALAPQMVASTVGLPVPIEGSPATQTLVVGQLNGIPARTEIFALLEACGLTPQDWTLTTDTVVPPSSNTNEGEATLDLTVIAGLLPPSVRLKVVNTGGNEGRMLLLAAAACGLDPNADPATWQRSQLNTPVGGCIITNSYGTTEQNIAAGAFLTAVNEIMAGLSQAGVVVLFSAGDEGSGGCQPDSIGRVGQLAPQWLASHPDVLSVGGTMWVESSWNGMDFNPYTVDYVPGTRYKNVTWRDDGGGTDCTNTTKAGTGGGASSLYSRPAYQDSVSSAVPVAQRGSRLVPDLAGLSGWPMWAVDLPVGLEALRGTSAATPLTAVGLAHVNAALTARELTPVDNSAGAFDVHSIVYNPAFSSALTDVTEGSNDLFNLGGWSAQVGYDMTTGMGVPNFSVLLQLLIDAQAVSFDPQGPPPVLQQLPIPASGSCANVEDSRYNWGGAVTGGWGESWAQWANAGAGGSVCTRTLIYNPSFRIWVVAR